MGNYFIDSEGQKYFEVLDGFDRADNRGTFGEVIPVKGPFERLAVKYFTEDLLNPEEERNREVQRLELVNGLNGFAPRVHDNGFYVIEGAGPGGTDKRYPAFLMDFAPGNSLKSVWRSGVLSGDQEMPIPADKLIELMERAAPALRAMEERGISHGDPHLGNFMVRVDSENLNILSFRIVDFGITRENNRLLTPTPDNRRRVGTFDYMAPEACFGNK